MTITPTQMNVGVGAISMGATDLGGTVGGIKLRQEDSYVDLFCDQVAALCGAVLSMRRQYLSFNLAEITIANLRRAWNLASGQISANGSTLTFVAAADTATTALIAKVNGGVGKIHTYTWTDCRRLSTGELTASREGQTVIPVEVEIKPQITGDPPVATFGTCVEAAT